MKNQDIVIEFKHLADRLTDTVIINDVSLSDHIRAADIKAILPLMERISKTGEAFAGFSVESCAEGIRQNTTIADISEVCALFIGIGASMASGSGRAQQVTRKLVKTVIKTKPHSVGLEKVHNAATGFLGNDNVKGLIAVTIAYGATLHMMNKRAQWNPLYWIYKLTRWIKK